MTPAWACTDKGDPRCRRLADKHYTRQSPGDPQWTRPGFNLTLYFENGRGPAVFNWWRPKFEGGIWRKDDLLAVECTIFRNKSGVRSSDLVADAVACLLTWQRMWPNLLIITGVDSEATQRGRSKNSLPGKCFRDAGFVDMEHAKGRADVWLVLPRTAYPVPRRADDEPRGQVGLFHGAA